MLKSYGGYTWEGRDPVEQNPERNKVYATIGLGLLGAGGLHLSTQQLSNGYRPIDYISSSARFLANLAPLQLGNTLRVPEALSPFISPQYRGLGKIETNVWKREFLTSDSSYDWIKYSTGLNQEQLSQRGISRGMPVGGADRLEFIQTGRVTGRLESVVGNQRHVLNNNMALISMGEEVPTRALNSKVNRFAAGMFAASDMYKNDSFSENDVGFKPAHILDDAVVTQSERSAYMFMPSPTKVSSVKDIERASTYWRGIPAFEMGRFNQLLKGLSEGFGDTGKKVFKAIGGGIRPGPASAQFARYGGLAALGGVALMANEQLDWFRRQSSVGHIASSAIVAGGASYIATRAGLSSRHAVIAGLATFATQMLPGFNQGLMEGIATTGVNLDVARGSFLNPFNYYRRSVEGYAPGISDYKTGAFLGVLALGTMITTPGLKYKLNTRVAQKLGDPMLNEILDQNKSARDLFYERLGRTQYKTSEETLGFVNRTKMLAEHQRGPKSTVDKNHELNSFWSASEKQYMDLRADNKLNERLVGELETIASGSDHKIVKELKGLKTELYHNYLGADLGEAPELLKKSRALGFKATSRLGRYSSVSAGAMMAHAVLTGGLLGSMEDSKELADIYSGKQLVEVKKGRGWEMGGTEYEGGESSYFRPHAYHLMMNRVRSEGIWGKDISPLEAFYKKNFTYDLELESYWDRPYPITNGAFADVPVIGGILSQSIGMLFKQPKLMHTNEWARERGNGPEFAHTFKGGFVEPAFELGAIGEGRPVSPYSTKILHSDLRAQFTELEGLPGWLSETVMKGLTGSSVWSSDQARLATSGEMSSWNRRFQESQVGGLLFSNEFVRRLLPNQSSEIKKYNPLINSMPSWLPDKFHYGDPYSNIEWGEARLPGKGYAALHPELKNVDAEAYPLLYQYQILADVAPLTPEFYRIQSQVYGIRKENKFTAKDIEWIDRVDERRRKQVNKYSYEEDKNAIQLPGSGITRGIWNGGLRALRELAAPIEYLTPMGFRPVQKLLGEGKTAIERYESERLYGTPLAFWDKPWRDWFRPALYSTAHLLGFEGQPQWKKEGDAVSSHFDKLQFIKYMNLAKEAEAMGDSRAVAQFKWQASQTRVGISPNASPLSMYWTLPGEDRAYFNAFAQAQGSDRDRILEMVAADQKNIYQSIWSRIDNKDPSLYSTGSNVDMAYMQTQLDKTYQGLDGEPMPDPDWIGWRQEVDLSDIQVRYVERIGADLHDYGLWESGLKKSMAQPFLEGSDNFMTEGPRFSSIRSEIHNILGQGQINYSTIPGVTARAHVIFNDHRDSEVQQKLQRYLNEY